MKLVAAAVAAFPSYHDRDMVPTADLWLELLGHLPFEVAKAAMIKVLTTAKYFPTPAQILAAAATIQPQELPDPEMAWQEVLDQIRPRRAISDNQHGAIQQWDRPPMLSTAAGHNCASH